MTLHLGIDFGVQGAIAIADQSGALLGIHDMPVLQDGPKGRRAINAPDVNTCYCPDVFRGGKAPGKVRPAPR